MYTVAEENVRDFVKSVTTDRMSLSSRKSFSQSTTATPLTEIAKVVASVGREHSGLVSVDEVLVGGSGVGG